MTPDMLPSNIPEFINYLQGQFYKNEFLQAAIVGAPLAALSWTVRSLPAKIWNMIRFVSTVEMSFNSDMADYKQIAKFVSEEITNPRWSRRFNYQAERSWDDESGNYISQHHGMSVGYGRHYGKWKGRIAIIDRELQEGQQSEKFKERLHITLVSRSRALLAALSNEIAVKVASSSIEKFVTLYINSGDWWKRSGKLPLRPISTVFTSNGQGQALLDHIKRFEASRDECRRKGIPWHTGALLCGEPGTGKTSLIHAIASETNRVIYYLSLGAVEKDKELTDLITSSRDWSKALLVIEDADATGVSVSRRKKHGKSGKKIEQADGEADKPVTLSALLNVLDGLITPDGLVVIATTNHPERLDPALVRAGRFDITLDLGKLEFAAFADMARLMCGASDKLIETIRPVYRPKTGAELRALLNAGGIEAVILEMTGQSTKAA